MSVEILHLFKKKTDILAEQSETICQEPLEYKMKSSRQIFSSEIPLSLEKDNWVLVSTNFEFFITIFRKTKWNVVFSLFTAGYWTDAVTMKRMKNLSERRVSNDLEIHITEFRKRVAK